MLTIGIDPGLGGALALYDGRIVRVWDMPVIAAGVKGKKIIDRGALFDLVGLLSDAAPQLAAVEQIQGVRNQSAHASCEFGKSAGYAEMSVVGNRIPLLMVTPASWKAHFRLPAAPDTKSRKDIARRKASELLPDCRHLWARVSDDGRAEAALLAVYAYQHA
jgi:crossover junction endodeoxyribonuclease RuvC